MELQKLESISKIIASVFIPIAVAILGYAVNTALKQKETEAKLIELATIILSKEIVPNQTADQKSLRKWAVDVINAYSGVTMPNETKAALVDTVSLPATVEKSTEGGNGTYGVVFGGDKTIDAAQHEIKQAKKMLDIDAQIFLRSGSYRSVAVFVSRSEAEEALGKMKTLRSTAYVVDMTKWCTNATKQTTHLECKI